MPMRTTSFSHVTKERYLYRVQKCFNLQLQQEKILTSMIDEKKLELTVSQMCGRLDVSFLNY